MAFYNRFVSVIAVAAVVAILAIACILVLENNKKSDDHHGLSGTFEYAAEGEYDNGTMKYEGTWTIGIKNGEVVKNEKSIIHSKTGKVTLSTGGISYIPGTKLAINILGLEHLAVSNNSFLKNSHYYGTETIDTMYGKKTLKEFQNSNGCCYADDAGIIYRIITTDRGADVVFDLIRTI